MLICAHVWTSEVHVYMYVYHWDSELMWHPGYLLWYSVSRAKIYNKKRYAEKIEVKKKIRVHEERQTKNKREDVVPKGAVPAYLLDRYRHCFDVDVCMDSCSWIWQCLMVNRFTCIEPRLKCCLDGCLGISSLPPPWAARVAHRGGWTCIIKCHQRVTCTNIKCIETYGRYQSHTPVPREGCRWERTRWALTNEPFNPVQSLPNKRVLRLCCYS